LGDCFTSNTKLNRPSKYFNRNFRLALTILSLTILILIFIPANNAASNYNISYIDNSTGGNVLKNPEISQNIPKTNLSNQIFTMTKKGSVVLKFGNGKGPKLLISAGIHGNEEEANIAVMKYLEYIKTKSFNGTIYIIPFAIPQDTAMNSRNYKGLDPNRIANKKGTPGYKIIQFARNNGVKYLLDVHSGSQVGPKGHIFISNPSRVTAKEKNWSNYIKSKTSCDISTNGADSIGMVRNYAKSFGINTLTLEVERDSTPTMTAANAEYLLILAGVNYLGLPAYSSNGPKISSTNPVKGAVRVPLTSAVTITFTTNIKSGTNFSGIYIKNLNTGKKVALKAKTISGKTLTLKETYTRLRNNIYQVYIPACALKDTAGNILTTSYSYQFRTIK
jgi:predicted deacylase